MTLTRVTNERVVMRRVTGSTCCRSVQFSSVQFVRGWKACAQITSAVSVSTRVSLSVGYFDASSENCRTDRGAVLPSEGRLALAQREDRVLEAARNNPQLEVTPAGDVY